MIHKLYIVRIERRAVKKREIVDIQQNVQILAACRRDVYFYKVSWLSKISRNAKKHFTMQSRQHARSQDLQREEKIGAVVQCLKKGVALQIIFAADRYLHNVIERENRFRSKNTKGNHRKSWKREEWKDGFQPPMEKDSYLPPALSRSLKWLSRYSPLSHYASPSFSHAYIYIYSISLSHTDSLALSSSHTYLHARICRACSCV